MLEVALLRMTVRRPEGDAECCVRQHIPPEIRGVVGPGAGVMVLAHDHDRSVAAVDWTATGEWIGAKLTFPTAVEQYDWPPREGVAGAGVDRDPRRERAPGGAGRAARRGGALASARLVSLTPLRSRVDQRDEWQITLQLANGSTVEIVDRVPLLALARAVAGKRGAIGYADRRDVSSGGEVAVDWESTLRQPELRSTSG